MRRQPATSGLLARWHTLRNVVLFVAGMAGIGFETIARRPPDYGLLPVFAGMIGLPWFVAKDAEYDDSDAAGGTSASDTRADEGPALRRRHRGD